MSFSWFEELFHIIHTVTERISNLVNLSEKDLFTSPGALHNYPRKYKMLQNAQHHVQKYRRQLQHIVYNERNNVEWTLSPEWLHGFQVFSQSYPILNFI